jgi:acetyl esterase
MPLDPQLAAMLKMMNEQPQAAGLDELRKGLEANAVAIPGRQVQLRDVRTIELQGPNGPISARLYKPCGNLVAPLTVYYHGGGFVAGSLDTHDGVCREMAAKAKTAVLSVGYRLAPEYPFPIGLDDAYHALAWAAENGGALEVDASRLAVAGDSAGATIALVSAIRARDERKPALSAQLIFYPCTDLRDTPYLSRVENAVGYGLTETARQRLMSLYTGDDTARHDPRASPLLESNLKSLPPTLMMTCQYDPLRDEGMAMAEALYTAGADITQQTANGMIHGFINYTSVCAAAAAYYDQALLWLARQLHSSPSVDDRPPL